MPSQLRLFLPHARNVQRVAYQAVRSLPGWRQLGLRGGSALEPLSRAQLHSSPSSPSSLSSSSSGGHAVGCDHALHVPEGMRFALRKNPSLGADRIGVVRPGSTVEVIVDDRSPLKHHAHEIHGNSSMWTNVVDARGTKGWVYLPTPLLAPFLGDKRDAPMPSSSPIEDSQGSWSNKSPATQEPTTTEADFRPLVSGVGPDPSHDAASFFDELFQSEAPPLFTPSEASVDEAGEEEKRKQAIAAREALPAHERFRDLAAEIIADRPASIKGKFNFRRVHKLMKLAEDVRAFDPIVDVVPGVVHVINDILRDPKLTHEERSSFHGRARRVLGFVIPRRMEAFLPDLIDPIELIHEASEILKLQCSPRAAAVPKLAGARYPSFYLLRHSMARAVDTGNISSICSSIFIGSLIDTGTGGYWEHLSHALDDHDEVSLLFAEEKHEKALFCLGFVISYINSQGGTITDAMKQPVQRLLNEMHAEKKTLLLEDNYDVSVHAMTLALTDAETLECFDDHLGAFLGHVQANIHSLSSATLGVVAWSIGKLGSRRSDSSFPLPDCASACLQEIITETAARHEVGTVARAYRTAARRGNLTNDLSALVALAREAHDKEGNAVRLIDLPGGFTASISVDHIERILNDDGHGRAQPLRRGTLAFDFPRWKHVEASQLANVMFGAQHTPGVSKVALAQLGGVGRKALFLMDPTKPVSELALESPVRQSHHKFVEALGEKVAPDSTFEYQRQQEQRHLEYTANIDVESIVGEAEEDLASLDVLSQSGGSEYAAKDMRSRLQRFQKKVESARSTVETQVLFQELEVPLADRAIRDFVVIEALDILRQYKHFLKQLGVDGKAEKSETGPYFDQTLAAIRHIRASSCEERNPKILAARVSYIEEIGALQKHLRQVVADLEATQPVHSADTESFENSQGDLVLDGDHEGDHEGVTDDSLTLASEPPTSNARQFNESRDLFPDKYKDMLQRVDDVIEKRMEHESGASSGHASTFALRVQVGGAFSKTLRRRLHRIGHRNGVLLQHKGWLMDKLLALRAPHLRDVAGLLSVRKSGKKLDVVRSILHTSGLPYFDIDQILVKYIAEHPGAVSKTHRAGAGDITEADISADGSSSSQSSHSGVQDDAGEGDHELEILSADIEEWLGKD